MFSRKDSVTGEFLRTLATPDYFLDVVRGTARETRRDKQERYFFVYKETKGNRSAISPVRVGTGTDYYGTNKIITEDFLRAYEEDEQNFPNMHPIYFFHSHHASTAPSLPDLKGSQHSDMIHGIGIHTNDGIYLFQYLCISNITDAQIEDVFNSYSKKAEERVSERAQKSSRQKQAWKAARNVLNDPKWGRIAAARLRESGYFRAYLFPLLPEGFSEEDLQRIEEFAHSLSI